MSAEKDHPTRMQQAYTRLIDSIDLSELQKDYLRLRWLDQVAWMEGRAARTQRRYYGLRLVTIIGGVLIPAVVGVKGVGGIDEVTRWIAFGLGLVVAVSAAVEEFFNYGERWRHYRRTAETLKTEGWQFFQLIGPYAGTTYADAYSAFAGRVEGLLQQDVQVFVTRITQEKGPRKPPGGEPPAA
jgi:hypothetical protein